MSGWGYFAFWDVSGGHAVNCFCEGTSDSFLLHTADFSVELSFRCDSFTTAVEFGIDDSATDKYDKYYDKPLPPLFPDFNPDSLFEAYLEIDDSVSERFSCSITHTQYSPSQYSLQLCGTERWLKPDWKTPPTDYNVFLLTEDGQTYNLCDEDSIYIEGKQLCNLYLTKKPAANADSMWAIVNVTTDTIKIVRRADTSNVLKDVSVCIDNEDTFECGTTNASGKWKPSLNLTNAYDIYCTISGYCPLKVQHIDSLYGNEVWCNDVELRGDAFVCAASDTLTILPGTKVRFKPNSDASSRSDDYNNSKCEIVVKGGHARILGNSSYPVTFGKGPGTGTWYGIYVRSAGTLRTEWAIFRNASSSIFGYNTPNRIIAKHCRSYDGEIYIDFGANSTDKILQIDSCYSDRRIAAMRTGDSSWIKACSISVASRSNECIYVDYSFDTLLIQDCFLESSGSGLSGFGIRNQSGGWICCINTKFSNDGTSIAQYGIAILDSCYHTASHSPNYCIREATTNASTKSRKTVFEKYITAGFYALNWADFGTYSSPGHNCFLENTKVAIKFDTTTTVSDTVWAQKNYFDTLYFGGSGANRIIRDSAETLCNPDTSLKKIALPQVQKTNIPKHYSLGPAVPNPFNSTVEISFEIPQEIDIELAIFDVMGRQIKTVASGKFASGAHRAIWNGKDDTDAEMPSGVYLYRLRADGFTETKKMTLIR